jgi:DNA invertase Pin-like site-specific DNA recombinase
LYSEAEPIVIAAVDRDEAAVTVVKVEVSGEILWCWIAMKPAIPPPLLIRKKPNWHGRLPQFLGGEFAKVVSFAIHGENPISADSHLQKYAAKAYSFARTFANDSRSQTMKIGYARVSTLEQNLDLQLQALKKASCKKIFREKVSGASRHRPEFQRMLDQLREEDIIVVWKLDRLARSTRDLLETMETIRDAGARFQSLSEPWADTTTHAGKMIMTVFAGIAEFERHLIRERTQAGRDAAKSRGVRFGRPRKLNPEQTKLAQRLVEEGKAVREVAETFNVHVATIYRVSAAEL